MRNTMKQLSTFPDAKCCNKYHLNLQLFGEGGAQGGTAQGGSTASGNGGAASTEAASPAAPEPTKAEPGETLSRAAKRQAKAAGEKLTEKNPLATVKYGKSSLVGQDAAVPQTKQTQAEKPQSAANTSLVGNNTSSAETDKMAAFEKMIRGEYKEQFAARTQNIVNQRFKETKQLEAKSQKADALIAKLAQRYGMNGADVDGILKMTETDQSYTEKEAKNKGLSVEEMRRVKALESENARLRSSVNRHNAKDAAEKVYQSWVEEGQKLKQIYPEFDFRAQASNKAFTQLLKAGVPLRQAYEVTHLEKILGGAMQYTADQVTKGMVARISDRSSRPMENGATPHAGAVVKPDVKGLSRADREEIERRVMRGEKILF